MDFFRDLKENLEKNDTLSKIANGVTEFIDELTKVLQSEGVIGKDVDITGYIATIENFFEMKGKKYHEILFIHKAEFNNDKDKLIQETLKNVEGKDYLRYEWLNLNNIQDYPLRPCEVKKVLEEKIFPVHKINKEIK